MSYLFFSGGVHLCAACGRLFLVKVWLHQPESCSKRATHHLSGCKPEKTVINLQLSDKQAGNYFFTTNFRSIPKHVLVFGTNIIAPFWESLGVLISVSFFKKKGWFDTSNKIKRTQNPSLSLAIVVVLYRSQRVYLHRGSDTMLKGCTLLQ